MCEQIVWESIMFEEIQSDMEVLSVMLDLHWPNHICNSIHKAAVITLWTCMCGTSSQTKEWGKSIHSFSFPDRRITTCTFRIWLNKEHRTSCIRSQAFHPVSNEFRSLNELFPYSHKSRLSSLLWNHGCCCLFMTNILLGINSGSFPMLSANAKLLLLLLGTMCRVHNLRQLKMLHWFL